MNGILEGSSPGAGKAGGHGERKTACVFIEHRPPLLVPTNGCVEPKVASTNG